MPLWAPPDQAAVGSDLPTTWSVVPVKAASRVWWNLRDAACRRVSVGWLRNSLME